MKALALSSLWMALFLECSTIRAAEQAFTDSNLHFQTVFSSRETESLHTRWFRINSDLWLPRAPDVTGFGIETGSSGESQKTRPEQVRLNILGISVEIRQDPETGRRYYASAPMHGGWQHVTVVTSADRIVYAARLLFTKAGVDFTQPGKQLFFNDRLGMLFVRATMPELEIIEQAVQDLQTSSPRPENEVRSVEPSQRGGSREATGGATAETEGTSGAGTVTNQPRSPNPGLRAPRYVEWVARFFSRDVSSVLTPPSVVPDRDGFSNGVEYVSGTSTVRIDSVPRTAFVRVRVGNEDYPAIRFRRPARGEDPAYILFHSSDLVIWSRVSSITVAVSAPDAEGMEAVTIRALTPMSGAQQQILRLDLPISEDVVR